MVSLLTVAPYTSAKCAAISPVVSPRRERQDDLIDPVQAPLPFPDDARLEGAVPVPGHLDLHRADLGEHRLGPCAIAGVAAGADQFDPFGASLLHQGLGVMLLIQSCRHDLDRLGHHWSFPPSSARRVGQISYTVYRTVPRSRFTACRAQSGARHIDGGE